MKINMSLDFTDVTEMKIFLTSEYPFGKFFEPKATVEQAETVVKKSRKKKEEAPKEEAAQSILAAAMKAPVEELAVAAVAPVEVPTPAPVAVGAPAPVAPAPVVAPPIESAPVAGVQTPAAPAPVATSPVTPGPAIVSAAPTALGDALAQAAPTAAVTYTESDMSRAGAALVTAGRQVEVVNLLNGKYGANGGGIRNIDPSRYAELAADFRAMGAQI